MLRIRMLPRRKPERKLHARNSSIMSESGIQLRQTGVGGAFRFTLRKESGPRGTVVFSWQAECPFHRKNAGSACRKTARVNAGAQDWDTGSERTLLMLMHWANCARDYDRQRGHMGLHLCEGEHPPAEAMEAAKIKLRPLARVPTDVELDSGEKVLLPQELWFPIADSDVSSSDRSSSSSSDSDVPSSDGSSSSSSDSSD